jgi:hypothetical protein
MPQHVWQQLALDKSLDDASLAGDSSTFFFAVASLFGYVEEYFQLTTCNIGFDKQSLEPKDRLYLTH